jgi:ADP-ribosyltransferase of polymorphic toxin system
MPGYSLVPVDYQPDFGDYSLVPVDYDPFAADDIIQRTRTQLASQPQPDAGFDQPPSAPQTPGTAPPLSPIVPNDGQAPSVPQPPGQDLHSQYQALRPTLGVPTSESARSSYYNSITAGADDFFRSIPRGIVSGLNSAGSALARATQAEMGQDVDAPTPAQGMEILEKNVTGPLHRPEGRAGKLGASAGEFLGNPSSYVVPGSLPFKVGMAALGGLGSEAGGQLGEGTSLELPLRILGGLLGGLGAAKVASASKVKPPTGAVEDVRGAGLRNLYHYTDEAGLNGILNEGKLNPSLKTLRPRDVKYGNGQYFTDIPPGTMIPKDLSTALVQNPYQVKKFTHYLEINPNGLNVIQGRSGVYVIPNEVPLDLNNRIISSGKVSDQ